MSREEKKKAQHPVGFKPTSSKSRGVLSTAVLQQLLANSKVKCSSSVGIHSLVICATIAGVLVKQTQFEQFHCYSGCELNMF